MLAEVPEELFALDEPTAPAEPPPPEPADVPEPGLPAVPLLAPVEVLHLHERTSSAATRSQLSLAAVAHASWKRALF